MSHGNTYIHINQINKQPVKIILEHVYSSEILKILTVSQFANVKDMYFYGSGVSIGKKTDKYFRIAAEKSNYDSENMFNNDIYRDSK